MDERLNVVQAFVHERLIPDHKALERSLRRLQVRLHLYQELRIRLQLLKEQEINGNLDVMTDLGEKVFTKANIPSLETIYVNTGLGLVVGLTQEQTFTFLDQVEELVVKQIKCVSIRMENIQLRIQRINEGVRQVKELASIDEAQKHGLLI